MARRRGLGRGLDALLESEALGLKTVAVSALKPNRFQPRADFNQEGLAELAESIRSQGIVQPLVVTPSGDGFLIVAGERRWRAAQRAGLTEIPVVVREVDGDQHLLELALVENLQRADLNAIEEADAYRSLGQGFGLSHEEIGRRVGKSRATVTNALRLLNLPPEIRDMLRAGRLNAGQARPLVALAVEDALRLAKRAARDSLSARKVEELATTKPLARTAPHLDPDTQAAVERLTRKLQTKVEIKRRGRGGAVILYFHDEEGLMRLFDHLTRKGNMS
ncbi:MAG: ParB/RepB/Spo0J family partition protein [Acidobacteria bacterium]|nr:ParB/RepB/Spo0J family partition protein [Acidobacteriota bacterium]